MGLCVAMLFGMTRENIRDLFRQRAGRRRTIYGIAPQIAERARERTLGAGEKDRQRPFHISTRPPLLLDQRPMRGPCIDARLRSAETSNPQILSPRTNLRAHACAA